MLKLLVILAVSVSAVLPCEAADSTVSSSSTSTTTVVGPQNTQPQNNQSITPQGSVTPGDCMKFGTSQYHAADAGAPCNTTLLGGGLVIGSTVQGAVAGKCLTVDTTGKLAQVNCLIAQ